MFLAATFNANDAKAFGELLRMTRERGGWSLIAMAKKTGLREAQLLALEECDCAIFRRNNQEMLWAARLYARKLGLEMPPGICFAMKPQVKVRASEQPLTPTAIPAFLMKAP